jgi:PAS domain S-box-containing protein
LIKRTIKSSEEKSLRESEALYRSIIDNQTEFVTRFCPDGTLSFANRAYCDYLGKKYDELVGQNFIHMFPEDSRERVLDLLSSLTAERPSETIEIRFMNPDGKPLLHQWTHRAVFDDKGDIIAFQAVGNDITDRKTSEQTSLPSSLYHVLFETAPVGLGIADMQGNLITFNNAVLEAGGYDRKDIAQMKNVSAFYYDVKDREKVLEIFLKQGFLHQHPVRFKRKDGSPYAALLSLRPATYAGNACIQAMVEDVEERKMAEDALKKSEKKYRDLFNNAPIALCEIDLSTLKRYLNKIKALEIGNVGTFFENNLELMKECISLIKITDINKEMLKLFKANTKQDFAEHLADVFHPETYNSFKEVIFALAEKKMGSEHKSVAQTLTGDLLYVFLNWFVSLGCEETLSSVVLSVIDLTELKITEEKLEQTEEKFGKLLETMNEGFGMHDKHGLITYVNDKLCRMFGYSRSELIGKHLDDFLDEPNRKILREQTPRLKMGSNHSYDIDWLNRKGDKFSTLVSPMPLYDQSGRYKGSFATLTDITERKKDERLILSYQKQLSRLASKLSLLEEEERRRIALDLHDNIGQILACAKMKLGELKELSDATRMVDVSRIRELIEQCISYTRSLTFKLSVPLLFEFGLEPAVNWLGQEYQKLHSIRVHVRDDGTSKPLSNDMKIILFRAVRELMTNAVKHAHAHHVIVSMEHRDDSIQIAVEDDGIGFNVKDIFEVPKENCFGLFSIREALRNCKGSIEIASAPGSATRITLTAPLSEHNNRKDG